MKIAIVSGGGHEVGVPSSAASLLVAKALAGSLGVKVTPEI